MLSGFCLKSVTATSCDNHVRLLENPSFESPACFLFRTVFADRAGRDFDCAWFIQGHQFHMIRWLRATPAQEMETGVWHSPESPSSTHTNYFNFLPNAIVNYMTCRTLMIRAQYTVLLFSFQKVDFTSVTNSGVRHGVAGKHHVMYSISGPQFSNRKGIEVTGQRRGGQWCRLPETIRGRRTQMRRPEKLDWSRNAHLQNIMFGFCHPGRAFGRLGGLMSLLNSDWDWETQGTAGEPSSCSKLVFNWFCCTVD